MMAVFTKANEALFAAHGTVFLVGNTHDILYPNSGSARDWAKGPNINDVRREMEGGSQFLTKGREVAWNWY